MKTYKNRKKKHISKLKTHYFRSKKNKKIQQKLSLKQNKKHIKYKISLLPIVLQKQIYIWTWRLYWRQYVPITAKIPSWQYRANHIQKQLWEARFKNIHFLHLPFMGCQCDFCINDTKISYTDKHCHSLIQYRHPEYFPDKFMPAETISFWNEHLILKETTLIKNFDPLCGSYKENKITKRLRQGYPIQFNQDTLTII